MAVDLLVGAPIDPDRFPAGVVEHRGAVIAVRAGIGHDPHLQRRQRAVPPRARLHGDHHRVSRGGGGELFFPRELELDRAPGPQRGEHDDVLDQHLLLAAEPAADLLAKHPDLGRIEIEDAAERAAGEERHLRAGADIEHAILIEPGNRGMGLHRRMLDPLGGVGLFMHQVGFGETLFDVAATPRHLGNEVAAWIADARLRTLVVKHGRARAHCVMRVEHRWQQRVIHLESPAPRFRRGFAVGDNRSDALADEANHIVEHARVVGIIEAHFMTRRRK